jgi:hypothetical protein
VIHVASVDHRDDVIDVARAEALQLADDDVDHIEYFDLQVSQGGV